MDSKSGRSSSMTSKEPCVIASLCVESLGPVGNFRTKADRFVSEFGHSILPGPITKSHHEPVGPGMRTVRVAPSAARWETFKSRVWET